MNLKARATDIRQDQLQQATGCRYDINGAVSSDKGRKPLSSLGATVRGLSDATIGGTKYIVAKAGTNLYADDELIGAFGTGTGHLSQVVWNNRVYAGDGTTLKRLSKSGATWTMEAVGLDAPAAAPTTGVSGSGNLIDTGTYKYVFTYYNGVAESNMSPVASQAVVLGEQVDLSDITAGPEGTTERRIYRSKLDGVALFYLGKIADNTTTTYTDTARLPDEADAEADPADDVELQARPVTTVPVDAASHPISTVQDQNFGEERRTETFPSNLGILADWTDHDPPPTDLTHLMEMRAQIFGISENKVCFSKTGQPEHWPIYNKITIGRQTGETIKAILPLNDSIVVYTDARVHRIDPVGLSFEDSRVVVTDSPVGLAAEWGVSGVTLGNGQAGHLFLANKGIYLFDGNTAVEVSRDIEELFEDQNQYGGFNLDYMSNAVMASHRDRVWMSYTSEFAINNNATLYADFQDSQNIKIAILPYALTSMGFDRVGNVAIGGDEDGATYELGNGTEVLLWAPTSMDYDFGQSTVLKRFEELVIDADLGDTTTTVTVTTDLGRTATISLKGMGRKKYHRHLPKTLKGNYASIGLSSTSAAERHWYNAGLEVTMGDTP